MRKLDFMLCVTCLFAIASADHRNCWAVTWSWFDNNAGGSETKPTAEDFADSEKAPPVGMPDGVPAVQKHGKCLCGEHEHKIEIIENMKYWWLKDYDLCSEDDTIYYVNASDFAADSPLAKGGRGLYSFCAGFSLTRAGQVGYDGG